MPLHGSPSCDLVTDGPVAFRWLEVPAPPAGWTTVTKQGRSAALPDCWAHHRPPPRHRRFVLDLDIVLSDTAALDEDLVDAAFESDR